MKGIFNYFKVLKVPFLVQWQPEKECYFLNEYVDVNLFRIHLIYEIKRNKTHMLLLLLRLIVSIVFILSI